jgi:hypothetical protein
MTCLLALTLKLCIATTTTSKTVEVFSHEGSFLATWTRSL